MRNRRSSWGIVFLIAILSFSASDTLSQNSEQYFYGNLGRLTRVLQSDGQIATYQYDTVGNLLGIFRTTGGVGSPTINEISPSSVVAGGTETIILKGSHLDGALFAIDNLEIQAIGVKSLPDQVTVDLSIPNPTRFGSTRLTLTTRFGSASADLEITPPPLVLTRLTPAIGLPGDEIVFEGTGFGTAPDQTTVQFMGETGIVQVTPRRFSPPTANRLTAVVPEGVIPGDVTVTVGTQTSNPFPFKVPIRLSLDTPIVAKDQPSALTITLPTPVSGPDPVRIILSVEQLSVAANQTPPPINIVGIRTKASFQAVSSESSSIGGVSFTPPTDTRVATVQTPILILPGEKYAIATVVGVSVGTAKVTAEAVGFPSGNITFQVDTSVLTLPSFTTVAPGRSVSIPVVLSRAAPPGGVRVVLTSKSSTIATVVSPLLIPEGQTSRNAIVTGISLGDAAIGATAPGYATVVPPYVDPQAIRSSLGSSSGGGGGGGGTSASVGLFRPVEINRSAIVRVTLSLSFLPNTIGLPPGYSGRAQLRLSSPAPAGGLTVKLISSNPTIAMLDQTEVMIPAGQLKASFLVKALSLGITSIIASHPNLPAASMPVYVRGSLVVSPITINTGCETTISLTLQDPAPINGIRVNLGVADLGVATVSPTEINFLERGKTTHSFLIVGKQTGTTTLTLSALGFPLMNQTIHVPAPQVILAPLNVPSSLSTISPPQSINVSLQTSNTCQQGLETDTVISLSSSDPNVVSVATPVTIMARMLLTSATIAVQGEGQARITASAPGFSPVVSSLITITKPRILAPSTITLGKGLKSQMNISLSEPGPPGGVTLSLTANPPNLLQVNPTGPITIPAGRASVLFTLIGQAEGTASLTVEATGFIGATTTVTVVTPTFRFQSLPSLTTLSGLTTYLLSVFPSNLSVIQPTQVTVTSSSPSVLTATSPITIYDQYTQGVMNPVSAGEATLTASAEGFLPTTSPAISVTQPRLGFSPDRITLGLGLSPYGDIAAFDLSPTIRLSDPAPPGGVTVAFTNDHPEIADISPKTLVFTPGERAKRVEDITAKNLGVATITATAPGWFSGTQTIFVVTPTLIPRTPIVSFRTVSTPQPFHLFTSSDPLTLQSPKGEVVVSAISSDPSVIRVDPTGIIPAGVHGSTPIFMTPAGPGSATISFSAPGMTGGSFGVTVEIPKLTLSPSELFARPVTNSLTLSISDPAPAGGLIVELGSSAPNVASVPASVLIPPLATSFLIPIQNGTEMGGTTLITAFAEGYIGTQSEITVEPIFLTGLAALAKIGEPVDISIPSANTGQSVSITGQDFRPTDRMLIPIVTPNGFIAEAEVPMTGISPERTQASFVVPFNAMTGLVTSVGASDAFPLQVVPTILKGDGEFKPGATYTLMGNGFVEGASRIVTGPTEIADDSSDTGMDVTENGANQIMTFLLPEEAGSTIAVRTAGGQSNLFTAGPLAFNSIQATAEVGQPADPGLPSANAGQWIAMTGEGLRSNHFLLVATSATSSRVAVPLVATSQETKASILVPKEAITGLVQLYGTTEKIPLQIVPKISGAKGSLIAGSRLDITGSGFVAGETEILLGNITIPASSITVEDSTRLNLVFPDSPDASLRVKTSGGISNNVLLPRAGGIGSVADLGLPADPATPSANVGQVISIIGQNLNTQIHVEFSGIDDEGVPIMIKQRVLNVSPDGRFLTVLVPDGAATGIARLVFTQTSGDLIISTHPLQIVPYLSEFNFLLGDPISTAIGSGFIEGGTTVVTQESRVQPENISNSGSLLNVRLPSAIPEGTVWIETAGGKSNWVVSTLSTNESEINDTPPLADFVPLGYQAFGKISPKGDIDYYQITVNPGVSVSVLIDYYQITVNSEVSVSVNPFEFCFDSISLEILTMDGNPIEGVLGFFDCNPSQLDIPVRSERTTYLVRLNIPNEESTLDAYVLKFYVKDIE